MSDYQFTAALDESLTDFIAHPGHFVDDIRFVHSLFVYPLVSTTEKFTLSIQDKTVLPVFTSAKSLADFKKQVATPLTYVNQSFTTVVDDLLDQEIDAIAFNLQPAGQEASNAIMILREHLVRFINRYITILNKLSENEDEAKADQANYFLIPAFVGRTEDGQVSRTFATLAQPDGESLIPVFSTISSFAKWYEHAEFGPIFQHNKGSVLAWQLNELIQPIVGKNDLSGIVGIAIDPFEMVSYDASIILWKDMVSD